jgi:hypothetical protein
MPDLAVLPGRTPLDKKVVYAGFDATELPAFRKQRALAESRRRQLSVLGMDEIIEHLTVTLLDVHGQSRREVSQTAGHLGSGPRLLDLVRGALPSIIQRYRPRLPDIDDQFCLGLLWDQTNVCHAWWHTLDGGAIDADARP